MAKIWSDITGKIIRFDDYDEGWPPPAEFSHSLRFDEMTNRDLVRQLLAELSQYTLGPGGLTSQGIPVPIAAPSLEYTQRLRRPRPLAAIAQDLAALSAGDRNRLLLRLLAQAIQDRPRLAREEGVAVDGDEPDDI